MVNTLSAPSPPPKAKDPAPHNWPHGAHQGHLPQLLPEDEEVSSIVDGPRHHPLGPVAELVEAVVDVANQLPADGELSLDVGWEEVLTGEDGGDCASPDVKTFRKRRPAGGEATPSTERVNEPRPPGQVTQRPAQEPTSFSSARPFSSKRDTETNTTRTPQKRRSANSTR